MRFYLATLLPIAASFAWAEPVPFSSDEEPTVTRPAPQCTATSSTGTGAYFDLRPDMAVHPGDSKTHRAVVTKDYHAKGFDYGKNFTMNICGAVTESVTDVVGVKENQWANVSAYYTSHGDVYSIGSESKDLQTRGRKLILQYINGSPCGDKHRKHKDNGTRRDLDANDWNTADQPTATEVAQLGEDTPVRRKSTTISFLCDRDPSDSTSIAFVGTDPDECAYFFEVRSVHACASAEPHKPGSVGPGSVFGIILLITILVYILGGVFYNRTVAHARGWRQLPNYSMWAGIWSFICDMAIIGLSSCARCLPGRRGYSHLSSSPTRRHRNSEAENRLIDQLDEEWDD